MDRKKEHGERRPGWKSAFSRSRGRNWRLGKASRSRGKERVFLSEKKQGGTRGRATPGLGGKDKVGKG